MTRTWCEMLCEEQGKTKNKEHKRTDKVSDVFVNVVAIKLGIKEED